MMRQILIVLLLALLGACSDGGGTTANTPASAPTPTPTPTSTPTPLANFTTVTIDAGPAALAAGPNGYTATNLPYVSVTLCVHGTQTCQTIDHVLLDTGSTGLRIIKSVLNANMLAGLPHQTSPAGNPVGECYQYVDGYVFGSVRTADFSIGGESVASMPFQVIADDGAFQTAPASCSSGGGTALTTVQEFGANGIIGVGTMATDCASACMVNGGSGAATYYDCPTSGCATVIARAANTSAPFQQLPNPVAAFAVNNNGTIVSLPAVPPTGAATLTGTVYFGIGTQTNNGLGNARILTTDSAGDLTATYKGTQLPNSFLDSGSNLYYFVDSGIPMCTQTNFTSFYCPPSPLALAVTLTGVNAATADASFTLYNAYTQPAASANAIPGIGANPNAVTGFHAIQRSFDFGLPFFYGRNVATAIEGRAAGGIAGPFYAF
ncbi:MULTISPECIES: DUF3443 family protein [unclassified Sphingomonas]|uniref:DUF3443 family protein n=1 Tax=unclassified Sphingomonas TaxID=196159 RepID=UPI00257998D4|nr:MULTISPECIES: DUF3443 family protein [unclassified Sphingomonas]